VNKSEYPLVKEPPLRANRSSLVVQPARSFLLLGALIFLILALALFAFMIKPDLVPGRNFLQPKRKPPLRKARRFPGSWPVRVTPMS